MADAALATAEGSLARTPLAHLLVYALDRRLTGALFFTRPGGAEDTVQLVRGVPVKVRPGDGYLLLGQMLVEAGAISAKTLDDALATKGLLGDVLLLAGCVERDVLEALAERQFVQRMVHLFELPREATYRYYEGSKELTEHGGEPARVDPLSVIWAGVREHAEASSLLEPTLARLGETTLKLHALATPERLGLSDDEATVVELLVASPMTGAELLWAEVLEEAPLRRLLYTLTITRQLDLGSGTLPVGISEPGAVTNGSPPAATLGRLALRATAYRYGAAAPDPPGGGDPKALTARRRKPAQAADGAPPSSSPVTPAAGGDAGAQAVTRAEDPLDKLSAGALLELAFQRLASHEMATALQACSRACKAAPADPDAAALLVWIRAQTGGADLKALTLELDELLRAHDRHAAARFYRGSLRKRLGDDGGFKRDLLRVLELDPTHAGALRELEASEQAAPMVPGPAGGLLKRLLGR